MIYSSALTTRTVRVCMGMVLALGALVVTTRALADDVPINRFFHSGNGHIDLISKKNGLTFVGQYRNDRQVYDGPALEAIHRVFDAPYQPQHTGLSLRLIEFLDYIQDRLGPGARITITSGYRPPSYNTKLRSQGQLAAKASLHQYGMAADFKIEGVPAGNIWAYVKTLGFGGAGYYQGRTVHVDVGPPRWWDEKTSGVGTGISDDNKLIGLEASYDVYRPGESVNLRFIRMTTFPIGVDPEFALVRHDGRPATSAVLEFEPAFSISAKGSCPKFGNIGQMASIHWTLPGQLPPGRYQIRAKFCDNPWPDMPKEILTPEFEVVPGSP